MQAKLLFTTRIVLSVLIILLFSHSAMAQWNNMSVEQLTNDSEIGHETLDKECLALDSFGNSHVTWISGDMINWTGNNLMYNSQNSDGNWGQPRLLADTTISPTRACIAISPVNDKPYIVYNVDRQIYISYMDGMLWARKQVSGDYDYNRDASIVIDDSGNIHIAWLVNCGLDRYDNHIAYAFGSVENLTEMLIPDNPDTNVFLGDTPAGPHIDVTSDRTLHIIIRASRLVGMHRYENMYHAWPSNDSWQYERVPSANVNDFDGELVIDSEDGIHIAMTGAGNWEDLKRCAYSYKSPDGIWAFPELISNSIELSSPSLTIDRNNRPHIAVPEVTQNIFTGLIYYAYKDNYGNWQCDSLISENYDSPSLRIDEYDNAKMAFLSGSFYGDVDLCYMTGDITTSIDDDGSTPSIPRTFDLQQNYPNPFNASTVISFTLENPSEVKLTVYDILGREVDKLIDGVLAAGEHSMTWTADSDQASSVYFYKLETEQETYTRQMVYMK